MFASVFIDRPVFFVVPTEHRVKCKMFTAHSSGNKIYIFNICLVVIHVDPNKFSQDCLELIICMHFKRITIYSCLDYS